MSEEERQKADELKKLLERVAVSGSFESVKLAEQIATHVKPAAAQKTRRLLV